MRKTRFGQALAMIPPPLHDLVPLSSIQPRTKKQHNDHNIVVSFTWKIATESASSLIMDSYICPKISLPHSGDE